MSPMERQYVRVGTLLDVLGFTGADVSVQSRPEAQTVRVVLSWRVGSQETAMFRGYTVPWLADAPDDALAARLKADVWMMQLDLMQRACKDIFALAARVEVPVGVLLRLVDR